MKTDGAGGCDMKTKRIISCILAGSMLFAVSCKGGNSNGQETEVSLDNPVEQTAESEYVPLSPVDLSTATVAPIPDEIYTGEEIYVTPVITGDGRELSPSDYILTYDRNVNIGTATVTATGNGDTTLGEITATFNIITGDDICDQEENAGLIVFVDRMYVYMLGRYPTLDEMTDNVRRLRAGSRSGMEFVNMIIQSPELASRGLSNTDFVLNFYLGVLNRNADEDGLWYNVSLLENGMSRVDLVNSIIDVPDGEFDSICDNLGITLGSGHIAGVAPDINDGTPSSSFNYSVDGRNVSIARRVYQFISTNEDGQSVFDLDAMCAASGYEPAGSDGSFVYSAGVQTLTLADGSMSLTISGDEVSYYEDTVEDGEETFLVNGTDTTVTLGMIVMIEYSLESAS